MGDGLGDGLGLPIGPELGDAVGIRRESALKASCIPVLPAQLVRNMGSRRRERAEAEAMGRTTEEHRKPHCDRTREVYPCSRSTSDRAESKESGFNTVEQPSRLFESRQDA